MPQVKEDMLQWPGISVSVPQVKQDMLTSVARYFIVCATGQTRHANFSGQVFQYLCHRSNKIYASKARYFIGCGHGLCALYCTWYTATEQVWSMDPHLQTTRKVLLSDSKQTTQIALVPPCLMAHTTSVLFLHVCLLYTCTHTQHTVCCLF